MTNHNQTKFGLPEDVQFCKQCVMSNQRPSSSIEFRHTKTHRHRTLVMDETGVCDACNFAKIKDSIDWDDREKDLLRLL